MAMERIGVGEFLVGQTLRYPVYDDSGNVLLNKGTRIDTHAQLTSLIEQGMYRSSGGEPVPVDNSTSATQPPESEKTFAFDTLREIANRLPALFELIIAAKPDAHGRLKRTAFEIQRVCQSDADMVLATIHLCHDCEYTVYHPMQQAILCEIVASGMGISADMRISMISAALTANISIIELQETLHSYSGTLSEEQQVAIQKHPIESIKILRAAGVDDPVLINAVLHHHENINGGGYPQHLDGEKISLAACFLAVADRYSAMVSGRSYRGPLSAKDALREFFIQHKGVFHEEIALRCIKELGIYPPGSFVKLANGETAVVIQRCSEDSMTPKVSSFMSPTGSLYMNPFSRDCAESEYAIQESCLYEGYDKLNCRSLWNFDD